MADHVYNADFYDYIDDGSRASARVVAPMLRAEIRIDSLLDVGAGHGAWAAEWMAAGVPDVVAIDGDYVRTDQLVIPPDCFHPHDLLKPLDLGRRFDLVQSLEVAEHLPLGKAITLVNTLANHGDVILFSAAVPYQGGEHHINEQPPEYWRLMFSSLGYEPFDWIRSRLANQRQVKPWYRYNTIIYANEVGQQRLSRSIRDARVDPGRQLEIGGDLAWMVRRAIVKHMPKRLIKPVAMAKASVEARLRGRARTA